MLHYLMFAKGNYGLRNSQDLAILMIQFIERCIGGLPAYFYLVCDLILCFSEWRNNLAYRRACDKHEPSSARVKLKEKKPGKGLGCVQSPKSGFAKDGPEDYFEENYFVDVEHFLCRSVKVNEK